MTEVPDWLHEMDSLQFLNLSRNRLTSSVDQFSRNYSLFYGLDLSFNSLGGDISSSICNASSLEILNLSHNKLTGIIPQCLGNLSYLQVLDLQMNKLHGTLPSTFSQNSWLVTLNLNGNQLEGPLPKSLSNCTSLQFLDLGNNQIKDTFPHGLQTLPDLEVLVLRANKLYGPITSLKGKNPFPSLKIFDISCNNFSGQIPKAYIKNFEGMKNVVRDEVDIELLYMEQIIDFGIYTDSVTLTMKQNSITFMKIPTMFAQIDLSKNMFEGDIPNVMGELHALKGLNLSHNRLIGPIPQSMGNLTSLESLDLSSNMLTGKPQWLVRMVGGRALEELRASLYNELRTSEGAKRQQQRYCGPVVALTFNFMVAVGIIMANKLVMGKVGFNFPIFLTFVHYITAWLLLAIFKALAVLPVSPPSKTTPFSSLFALGAVMAFASGLANTSLKYNSVGFYQMAKIAVTPTIVLAEFILYKKTISFNKVVALAVVSAGVAVATVTDLEFNLFGALVAIIWIIPSAINKILWSTLQQQGNWTALALMWKTTPITVFFLGALMPWIDPPGILSFKWDVNNSTAILVSALLGFLLQWSGALALGSDPGFVSIGGAVVALSGMSVYTTLNLHESKENTSKQLPKQILPSSKPKSASEDSTDLNVNITTAVV
ncbi:Sugar phosphate transporter domain [Sesbania bispinosa]|nr:Sugar phosphate transporter domain [Sesbania bispinosa]